MVAAWNRGLLIGAGIENQAVNMPQVVVCFHQFLFQIGQELGMDGRIIRPDVIRLVDDPSAQQPGPDTIGDIACEPRIVRSDQPIGKDRAGVLARLDLHSDAIGKHSFQGVSCRRIQANDFFFPLGRRLVRYAREESLHTGTAGLGPFFQAHPHKRQGHRTRDGGGFLPLNRTIEINLRHAKIAAARSQQLAGKLIVRHVLSNRIVNPAMIGLHRVGPQIDGKFRLDPQQIAPLQRPIVGKLIPPQQGIDQCGTLARTTVLQETAYLLRLRQRAVRIQIHAADKDLVGTQIRGPDALLAQGRHHKSIDTIIARPSVLLIAFKLSKRYLAPP